jgi:hypothetical protein
MPDASIVGAGIVVVVVVGISYLILVWTDIGGTESTMSSPMQRAAFAFAAALLAFVILFIV